MKPTNHALARSNQRGIHLDIVEIILKYGILRRKPGNVFEYRIRKRTVNELIADHKRAINKIENAKGKAVLVSGNRKQIITIYHIK
ncbi:MAG: hypothetical protein QQN41_09025 [Nitrosopumilus sp.]